MQARTIKDSAWFAIYGAMVASLVQEWKNTHRIFPTKEQLYDILIEAENIADCAEDIAIKNL